jgi:hypothetical protein
MQIYTLPKTWDAKKFAVRYGLNALQGDFYINAEGQLVVFPPLLDDPPIFENADPPKPPKPTIDEIVTRIEALEIKVK